jgi:hypothetical protein
MQSKPIDSKGSLLKQNFEDEIFVNQFYLKNNLVSMPGKSNNNFTWLIRFILE